VGLLEGLFPDNGTAYLFTADHGMTDHASHGDGAPHNVQTPLVAWGAGLRGTVTAGGVGKQGGGGLAWGMGDDDDYAKGRCDIEQAQLAPLMSALLGVPCPVHSVSLLPVGLLSEEQVGGSSVLWRAQAAWGNTMQLMAAFRVQTARVAARCLRFAPFQPLADGGEGLAVQYGAHLAAGDGQEAVRVAQRAAKLAIEGLEYLQVSCIVPTHYSSMAYHSHSICTEHTRTPFTPASHTRTPYTPAPH
jgi:phosphatidylinositol glycan class N